MRHALLVLVPVVALLPLGATARAVPDEPLNDCRSFASRGRLLEGQPFDADIGHQLHVRLVPAGPFGWRVVVNAAGDATRDYVWPVSPPYRTAPQLTVGPGYGLSAEQSAALRRDLKFVLDPAAYEDAIAAASHKDAAEVFRRLARIPTGTLTLAITSFDTRAFTRPDGREERVLAWVAFDGRACVPRGAAQE